MQFSTVEDLENVLDYFPGMLICSGLVRFLPNNVDTPEFCLRLLTSLTEPIEALKSMPLFMQAPRSQSLLLQWKRLKTALSHTNLLSCYSKLQLGKVG